MSVWMSGALGSWVSHVPAWSPSCPRNPLRSEGVPSLSPTPMSWLHPPEERDSCISSVSKKLSLGEVLRAPTQNPEGGRLGWSELNFLSI